MAFVLFAFEYLRVGGEMIAILPAGSVLSKKDKAAWQALRKTSEVFMLNQLHHRTFKSCSPSTVLVRIKKLPVLGDESCCLEVSDSGVGKETSKFPLIVRGTVQMHSVPAGHTPLIHSTDLLSYGIKASGRKTGARRSLVTGSFIAIARVGSPRKDKVALHQCDSEVALSDCVIAICCESASAAQSLHCRILESWHDLSSLYGGTGAKYITIEKLRTFIEGLEGRLSDSSDGSGKGIVSNPAQIQEARRSKRLKPAESPALRMKQIHPTSAWNSCTSVGDRSATI
jgi:hypothetical protein